jgi:hypothetical protein
MLKKSLVAVAATCMSMAVMANNTIVEMKTSMGNIEIELFNDKAPIHLWKVLTMSRPGKVLRVASN